jgi:hypothetical protein
LKIAIEDGNSSSQLRVAITHFNPQLPAKLCSKSAKFWIVCPQQQNSPSATDRPILTEIGRSHRAVPHGSSMILGLFRGLAHP